MRGQPSLLQPSDGNPMAGGGGHAGRCVARFGCPSRAGDAARKRGVFRLTAQPLAYRWTRPSGVLVNGDGKNITVSERP